MGFFDRDVRNGFDAMFDWNRDGVLDPCEQGLQFNYLDKVSQGKDPWDDSSDSEVDEYEEIQDEIEFMDREEAIEFIESEGYDVDDFDLDGDWD